MLTTGMFPDKLKITKTIQLYKKEDETVFTHYRPISHLTAISKIFERVLFKQLYEYFTDKRLFYSAQYGLDQNTLQDLLL